MVNAKEFLIFRVSLDNQTEPGGSIPPGPGCLARPHASFIATPQTSPTAPASVIFFDHSISDDEVAYPITSWSWNFGNGVTYSGRYPPTQEYSSEGSYLVRLRVSNACGSDEASLTVTVGSGTCDSTVTAAFDTYPSPPTSIGGTSFLVRFTNQSSSTGSTIVSHEWDFGDGSTATGTSVEHTYSYGIYWATLKVTDSCGRSDSATVQVSVTSESDCYVSPVISAVPSVGKPPLTVHFDDLSTTNRGHFTYRLWDLAEGNTTQQKEFDHTYYDEGVYRVFLTVNNSCGASSSTYTDITVSNKICPEVDADFVSNVSNGFTPLTVEFTDKSTSAAAIDHWEWNFGDGTVNSTVKNPVHTYNSAGTYPVIFTAINSCGNSASATGTITVTDCPSVTASFTSNVSSGFAPLSVEFTDTSLSSNPVTSWEWSFGDSSVNSTVKNPIHTYSSAGTYPVVLTAFNSCGNQATATGTIIVSDCPSVTASFTMNVSSGYAPLSVEFTDTSSGTEPVTSWEWNFGDSSENSTVKNPVHTFSSPGTYPVILTAFNSCGNQATATGTIIVSDCPSVTASFTTNVSSGLTPLSVEFTDTSISSDSITSWEWNFGDGSGNLTEKNPVHTYSSAGTYPVILTTFNSCGNHASATSTITVTDCHPVTASFTTNVSTGFAPLSVEFTDTSISGDSITSWEWNFGDVSINSTVKNPVHTYSSAGTYPVILTTFNSCGSNASTSGSITVTYCPPVTPSFTYEKVTNSRERIFYDDFEASLSGWQEYGRVDWYDGNPKYGTHDVRLRRSGSISRTISTSGYSDIIVSFALGADQLEFGEYVAAQWRPSNSESWIPLKQINYNDPDEDDELHDFSFSLPLSAADNSGFSLLFVISGDRNQDYGFVDNVEVTGIPKTLVYEFTDTSTSSVPITAWNWSFGDSTANSTLQHPSHTYSTAGSYRVILTAMNECGNNASISKRIYTEGNYFYGQWGRTAMEPAGVYPANRIRFADSAAGGYGSDMTNWPVPIIGRADNFSVRYDADLTITDGAVYTFFLTSDDGSWLWLDGVQIIDNGGDHAPQERSHILYLAPDTYPIQVKMYENAGGAVLYLEYSSPTMARQFVNAQFT